MKNTIKVVMVIIGTLIGAGFASGREIYLFFNKYGNLGKIGILISCIFTTFIIYKILNIVNKNKIEQYSELLEKVNPKHKKINRLIHLVVNSFLLISFYIMIAGFSAYLKQAYQIPTYISSIIFVLFCYIVFRNTLQGMMKINNYLVPILLFAILYLGIQTIPQLPKIEIIEEIQTSKIGFLISAILYTSYNSIILIPVLVSMKQYIKTKKEIHLISILTSIILLALSFSIYSLLLQGQFYIQELELPLLEITLQFGKVIQQIYGLVIIISIFTSAISTGYSFLENTSKTKKEYKKNLILISITGILISNIGFSTLVQILYPIFRNTWTTTNNTLL